MKPLRITNSDFLQAEKISELQTRIFYIFLYHRISFQQQIKTKLQLQNSK